MFRSRRRHVLLIAPLAIGLLLLATSAASADDEKPAPRKVRIRVEKKESVAPPTPKASPMEILHHWLMGHMAKGAADGKSLQEGLAAWFAGGEDVPLAGLRDALKAHGWNAGKLWQWMSRHGTAGTVGMGGPGRGQRFMLRGPTMHGPMVHGHGMLRGRPRGPFPQPDHGHGRAGAACPHCGHGAHAQRWFGWMPRQGGGWMGPGRMHRMHRFPGGPWGLGGMRGMHGMHGMHGRWGMAGPGAPGGLAPGHVHGDGRATILWNDGTGWKRREIPGGAGFGSSFPFPGGGGGAHVLPQPGHAPAPGGAGSPQVQQWLEWFRRHQPGAGAPGHGGRAGAAPAPQAISPEHVQQLMELLRRAYGRRGPVTVGGAHPHAPGVEAFRGLLENLQKRLQEIEKQKRDAAAKRVRIKSVAPKKLEVVEEEIEIK